ncbi:MAG TPA: alcohol dehydrogenase catalytic domain-containing protein [Lachnospiraceae bacterium]
MLQQVMTKPGKITFREVEIPSIHPNQVLVKIKRIGICGSDIHVYHGLHPYTKYPITQGHEVSGEIVEKGAQVENLLIGQKVTIEPQYYCGHCYPCRHGKYNLCQDLKVMGFQAEGCASQYFAVDASKVTPFSESMTFDEGAMIEPLAVTIHAAKRFSDVVGCKAVIFGCGPIGILLLQALKALGATSVLVTDISDYRLSLAKEMGADFAVNTKEKDFGQALFEAFGDDKADVMYDCAGTDSTMEQAIQNARKGSCIILVAVFGNRANVDLAKLNDSELDLNTSMMYRHEDYIDAIDFVSQGKISLEPLITKHFSFKNYQAAYRYIEENKEYTMKVMIDVDSSAEERKGEKNGTDIPGDKG